MSNFYILKLKYNIKFIFYLFKDSFFKRDQRDNKEAEKFLKFNNKIVLKRLKNKKIKRISILLPHCLQKDSCNFKITSDIKNCKKCGKCDIAEILKIKEEYPEVDVKVATGGTLARLYLKKYKPDLVLAVACKRDLISGIKDCFPLPVYGVFNEIINSPCIDTKVSVKKIREVIEEVEKE